MAKGSEIIVSAQPRGRFMEGVISGALKPGTVVEVVPATEVQGGEFTWRAFSKSSGVKTAIVVLLEDIEQGKLATDAYVSGTRCRLYAPANGEELNMLLADVAGTADTHAIGDDLMVQTGTGKLIANSSGASVPFVCLETLAAPTADTLAHCMHTGN